MSNIARRGMHRADGTVVQLQDLLARVPDNKWVWCLLDLYGVGRAPDGMTMPDFEELVRQTSGGFRATWCEIRGVASDLGQTYDCLLVAAVSEDDLVLDELNREDFGRCRIVIQAFDSEEWEVQVNDSSLDANTIIDV